MNKRCEVCAGTGQLCHFKGMSRFLLSYEDCPACCGTGCIDAADMPGDDDTKTSDQKGVVPQDDAADNDSN